ncbi:MAG TPA: energy transducer TonB [Acidobacteriaceae bacterium]
MKRTQVPLGDTLRKALEDSSLTGPKGQPFHVRVVVSEPENAQSPYQGTIEEWWRSADMWRRVVTDKDGMRQTIVMSHGMETERDEGDYFPLWLRSFVTALFDPVPGAAQLESSKVMIEQITLPNGDKSDACVNSGKKIGSENQSIEAWWNVCFDAKARLKFVGSPRYNMSFEDYKGFGNLQVARKLYDDPESGTRVVGAVEVLEDGIAHAGDDDLFKPLSTRDVLFKTDAASWQDMKRLVAGAPAIKWPTVRSGNISGRLSMYVSIDATGQVREAWPLSSDNAGLEDSAREQVRKWKLKPIINNGQPEQVDGAIAFSFDTKVENPLVILSKKEDVDQLTRNCPYQPVLPHGVIPAGITLKIRISVDEQGKEAGLAAPPVPWNMIHATGFDSKECVFSPYVVDGHPTYYYLDLAFTSK